MSNQQFKYGTFYKSGSNTFTTDRHSILINTNPTKKALMPLKSIDIQKHINEYKDTFSESKPILVSMHLFDGLTLATEEGTKEVRSECLICSGTGYEENKLNIGGFECRACLGDGFLIDEAPSGVFIASHSKNLFTFKESYLSWCTVERLITECKKRGISKIKCFIPTNSHKPIIFELSPFSYLALMPIVFDRVAMIDYKIFNIV